MTAYGSDPSNPQQPQPQQPQQQQQPEPQQQQYPSAPPPGAPGAPGAYGSPSAPVAPPRDVIMATNLMFAGAALGILGLLLRFADKNGFRDAIRSGNASYTESQIDAAYGAAIAVSVVVGLIFTVLYVVLALQVRKGRNWARIVTFVLAGLGILGGLGSLAVAAPGLSKLLVVIGVAIDIAIIVFLLRRPAKEFFAARRAPQY